MTRIERSSPAGRSHEEPSVAAAVSGSAWNRNLTGKRRTPRRSSSRAPRGRRPGRTPGRSACRSPGGTPPSPAGPGAKRSAGSLILTCAPGPGLASYASTRSSFTRPASGSIDPRPRPSAITRNGIPAGRAGAAPPPGIERHGVGPGGHGIHRDDVLQTPSVGPPRSITRWHPPRSASGALRPPVGDRLVNLLVQPRARPAQQAVPVLEPAGEARQGVVLHDREVDDAVRLEQRREDLPRIENGAIESRAGESRLGRQEERGARGECGGTDPRSLAQRAASCTGTSATRTRPAFASRHRRAISATTAGWVFAPCSTVRSHPMFGFSRTVSPGRTNRPIPPPLRRSRGSTGRGRAAGDGHRRQQRIGCDGVVPYRPGDRWPRQRPGTGLPGRRARRKRYDQAGLAEPAKDHPPVGHPPSPPRDAGPAAAAEARDRAPSSLEASPLSSRAARRSGSASRRA